MAELKHAYGYNKDGVLGVAGIFTPGASAGATGIPQILYGFGYTSQFFEESIFVVDNTKTPAVTAFGSTYTANSSPYNTQVGNGIAVFTHEVMYGAPYRATWSDGTSVNPIDLSSVGGTGNNSFSFARFNYDSNIWMIGFYDDSSGQQKITTTTDMLTFTTPISMSVFVDILNSQTRSYFGTGSDGTYVFAYYSFSYGWVVNTSSDLVTWSYATNTPPPTSWRPERSIGTLSDGRRVYGTGSADRILYVNEGANLSDAVIATRTDSYALDAVVVSVYTGYSYTRYTWGILPDDKIIASLASNNVQLTDLLTGEVEASGNLGQILPDFLSTGYTFVQNDKMYVVYNSLNYTTKVVELVYIPGIGLGNGDTLAEFDSPMTTYTYWAPIQTA